MSISPTFFAFAVTDVRGNVFSVNATFPAVGAAVVLNIPELEVVGQFARFSGSIEISSGVLNSPGGGSAPFSLRTATLSASAFNYRTPGKAFAVGLVVVDTWMFKTPRTRYGPQSCHEILATASDLYAPFFVCTHRLSTGGAVFVSFAIYNSQTEVVNALITEDVLTAAAPTVKVAEELSVQGTDGTNQNLSFEGVVTADLSLSQIQIPQVRWTRAGQAFVASNINFNFYN